MKKFFYFVFSFILVCLILVIFLISQQRLLDEMVYTDFVRKSIREERIKSGRWPNSLPDIPNKLKPTSAKGFIHKIMKVHIEAKPRLTIKRKDRRNFESTLYFSWMFGKPQEINIHL